MTNNVSTRLKTPLRWKIEKELDIEPSFTVYSRFFYSYGYNGTIILCYLLYKRDRLIEKGKISEEFPLFPITIDSLLCELNMGERPVRRAKQQLIKWGVIQSYGLRGRPPKEHILINDARIYSDLRDRDEKERRRLHKYKKFNFF